MSLTPPQGSDSARHAAAPARDGRSRSQCLISFGSNLGTRESLITEAAREVAASGLADGFATSRLFETPPIGGPGGQEPFLNAVAAFDTTASAREVLERLQDIETRLGRQRRRRWDARSIDLDVVLHGELVGGGTGLIVPHPRYTARQFVLRPACDVAAHYRDPRFGWTLKRLADHLSGGIPSLALLGGDFEMRETLCRRLEKEHGIRTFAARPIPTPMAVLGNAPAPSLAIRRPDDPIAGEDRQQSGDSVSDGGGGVGEPIVDVGDGPWVSAYVPDLSDTRSAAGASVAPVPDSNRAKGRSSDSPSVPRLVARIQRTTPETSWPAPHQMWPSGWSWPEYRLEVDDLDWAVTEIVSALDSMRCPVKPVTDDGRWWQT